MSSIFGDTDDIAFGSESQNKNAQNEKRGSFFEKKLPPRKSSFSSQKSTLSGPTTKKPDVFEPTHLDKDVSPLSLLINSMKSTFLPTGGEESLRIINLTSSDIQDTAFLIRAGDTAILYGTGFSKEIVNGKKYPTFPDMRIVASEKDRLMAWVLTDDAIDVSLFSYILPTLGFVPVYASRQLIARIRETLSGDPILEKCRFFELFTQEAPDRKIGDIELATIEPSSGSYLSLRFGDTLIYDERREVSSSLPKSPRTTDIIRLYEKEGNLYLGSIGRTDTEVLPGDIISLKPKKIEKHTLRFTFDTFYVDKKSIGVVAGYTLKDRKELGENGVLTFVIEEDRIKRAIIAHIYIDSRGFVHSHEMMPIHKEVLKGIRATYEKAVIENPRIERAELVQTLRRELTKYCYLLTGRTPVVMPIILER